MNAIGFGLACAMVVALAAGPAFAAGKGSQRTANEDRVVDCGEAVKDKNLPAKQAQVELAKCNADPAHYQQQ